MGEGHGQTEPGSLHLELPSLRWGLCVREGWPMAGYHFHSSAVQAQRWGAQLSMYSSGGPSSSFLGFDFISKNK